MDINTASSMAAVRNGWSDDERRVRKDRAGAMQLQLNSLVLLSGLSEGSADKEAAPTVAMASAC